MKYLAPFIFIISFYFISCTTKQGEELNKLSDTDFENLVIKEIKEHNAKNLSVIDYLDSLESLSGLSQEKKMQVLCFQSIIFYQKGDIDIAKQKTKRVIQESKKESLEPLVSSYYLLAKILEEENQLYQALYYYNKTGEILKRNNIRDAFTLHADNVLVNIALKNKSLGRLGLANTFMDAAIEKHKQTSEPETHLANFYVLKGGMFSVVGNLNIDSLRFYLNKAGDAGNDPYFQDNINYILAEYHYNTQQYDSALFYINKLSEKQKNSNNSDELNLLSIYSRQKQYKKADEELKKIQKFIDNGQFNASDSLLYLSNLVDYYLSKSDYKNAQKTFDEYSRFQVKFNNNEAQKNISELSSIMDLQQKEDELKVVKKNYEISLQRRNLIIILAISLLLIVLVFFAYMKLKSDKRKLLLENQMANLKIRLLQTQINPHFIFNTLASIQSLIRQDKNEMSIKYLNSFSILLRQILDLSRNTQLSLDKELSMLSTYIEMQKLRKANFDIQLNISPEVEEAKHDIRLPSLILQPFVENAIVHGFKDIDYKGEIVVNIKDNTECLLVNISDNGCGLKSKKKNNTSGNRKSHGIDIIREYLTTLGQSSGKQASLNIRNREDRSGTIVELVIPMIVL